MESCNFDTVLANALKYHKYYCEHKNMLPFFNLVPWRFLGLPTRTVYSLPDLMIFSVPEGNVPQRIWQKLLLIFVCRRRIRLYTSGASTPVRFRGS